MCDRKSGGDLFFGFAVGAAIGAFLGVLFAPEEGKKTREKAKKFIDDNKAKGYALVNEVSARVEEAKEKAQPLIEEIKSKIEPIMEKVETLNEDAREQVAEYVDDIREEISEKVEDANEGAENMKKRFFKGVKKLG